MEPLGQSPWPKDQFAQPFTEFESAAVNSRVWDALRAAATGATATAIGGNSVTVAVAPCVLSNVLVAMIVTFCCEAIEEGAVYRPVLSMLPAPGGIRDQVTETVSAYPARAVNCWVWDA